MKVEKNGKKAIRDFVAEELNKIPFDTASSDRQYVKFDKDFLEYLIFDENVSYGKYPVWTGEFLRRVDLSEICFDDVCFDGKRLSSYKTNFSIDLSYTNAKIDFNKMDDFGISCCNFSHMDLSEANVDRIKLIDSCDFSYSKAKFDFTDADFVSIINSNFECINLSKSNISVCDFQNKIFNCNFKNTAINIGGDLKSLDKKGLKTLGNEIKNGHLRGCYLNGKLILTENALITKKNNAKIEYNEYIEGIKQKIKTNIDDQVSNFSNN